MQEEIDQKIIQFYKEGDQQKAISLLLKTYQERLYWHIRRILFSHDDTDDVLQNTIVKAWRGLASFNGDSKLYTWLYRIATNEIYSYIEKNKKRKFHLDVERDLNLVSDINADDLNGDAIQVKLEKAIALLPEKQRMVFHLKYFEEMKYSEMSKVLNTSEGALKASYHIASKKIQEFLRSN
jgi:RNA polymerase sigma factor (sigma-70 family)